MPSWRAPCIRGPLRDLATKRDEKCGQGPAPANVLLITIDTLRWDVLGSYGGPASTPALDQLAEAGVRMEYAVAHAVMTLPSHTSILTGLDPSRHGVHDNTGFRAADELRTWPELLREAGYATAAFVGAFPLDSQFGLSQGFDHYDDFYGDRRAPSDFNVVERPAREVVTAARRWIARQEPPWFAWVHVFDPHTPYLPPPPFAERYADNAYAGEVAATDAALAPLLTAASGPGTLVVVTADHGEALGQHGELTHGVFAYDATLRVPLIIAWPDHLPAGKVISERARHIDILPTVLDLLGLPDRETQGRSLRPLLEGSAPASDGESTSYFEALTSYLTRDWAPLRGIYQGDLKFIDLPIPELYDVRGDRQETENLAEQDPGRVAALRALLSDHLAEAGRSATPEPNPASATTAARLRSLGYLGPTRTPGARELGREDDPKLLIVLDNRVHQAVDAGQAGALETAVAILEEVVAVRPDFARAHTLLAFIEARRGGLEDAIVRLQGAVDNGVDIPFLLNRLGAYLRDAGRVAEAREVLERSLAADPDSVETLSLLGAVYEGSGEGEAALAILERALRLDPTYASLRANYGTVQLALQRNEEATAAFELALQYDPKLPEAHNGLGVVAARADRPEEAVEHWRTAVALDPDQFDALYNLGLTLTRLNRFAEAIPVLEAFVARAPADRFANDLEGVRRLLQRLKGSTPAS